MTALHSVKLIALLLAFALSLGCNNGTTPEQAKRIPNSGGRNSANPPKSSAPVSPHAVRPTVAADNREIGQKERAQWIVFPLSPASNNESEVREQQLRNVRGNYTHEAWEAIKKQDPRLAQRMIRYRDLGDKYAELSKKRKELELTREKIKKDEFETTEDFRKRIKTLDDAIASLATQRKGSHGGSKQNRPDRRLHEILWQIPYPHTGSDRDQRHVLRRR